MEIKQTQQKSKSYKSIKKTPTSLSIGYFYEEIECEPKGCFYVLGFWKSIYLTALFEKYPIAQGPDSDAGIM